MSHGRLLVISDTPDDALDLIAALVNAGYEAAQCHPSRLDAQTDRHDLLLIDQRHVASSSTSTPPLVALPQRRSPHPPVLVLGARCAAPSDAVELPADIDFRSLETVIAAMMRGRRAEQLKDDFLSTVAHELRTPLNSIQGWADILMRQPREADFSQGLAAIERNARAQAQMLADLLDVSRMISGTLTLDLGPVEPGFVIDSAIKRLADTAAARHIVIDRLIKDPLPTVEADFERLQQIIVCLLSNAIRFSTKNARVVLRADRDDHGLRIDVTDTGRGIAPAVLPQLLGQFSSRALGTSRSGGLGLGLVIAQHLVGLHRGSLTAFSDGIGKGARFSLWLPLDGTNRDQLGA